jgi:hypothetical protein
MRASAKELVNLDISDLIPDIIEQADMGLFVISENRISIRPGQKRLKHHGLYYVGFNPIYEEDETAEAILMLWHPTWLFHRVILLRGTRAYTDDFRWSGYCPQTRKFSTTLYLDNTTDLFVSLAGISKKENRCTERFAENIMILGALESLTIERSASLTEALKKRGLKISAQLAASLNVMDSQKLEDDLLFAMNGLPFAKWIDPATIDVLGTVDINGRLENWPVDFIELCTTIFTKAAPRNKSSRGDRNKIKNDVSGS